MADPGSHTQEDGDIVLFANFERLNQHIFGLLAIRGLEHGRHGSFGVVAVILLVLRRELAGLIGSDDNCPAIDPDVGKGEERVSSNVETNMLHGCQRASASNGSADH